MAMYRRALSDGEKRAYLFPYDNWANRVAVDAFVKDIPMSPEHVSWPAIKESERGVELVRDRPALIYWGGRDFCFNDWFLRQWRERLPAARVVRLSDVGHYILEDAASEVVPRVAEFLTAPPA
jgi:cis-3-alkyl-4-acyloxetan-2-one decarboxylase